MNKIFSTVLLVFLVCSLARANHHAEPNLIRLIASLDEPEFYCIDLAGWGQSLQLDDPLQTHTCKTRNADDQLFQFAEGKIFVSKYDLCLQVAGSSGLTLPGSAVLAKPCSDSPLQKMIMTEQGLIQLGETGYCLGSGNESKQASGPSHLWRTLSVMQCDESPSELIHWKIGL